MDSLAGKAPRSTNKAQAPRKLGNAFALQIGDTIHLNTAVNGYVEGVVLKIDVLRLPADIPADPTDYIVGHCMYFGNGSDTCLMAAAAALYGPTTSIWLVSYAL